MSMEVSLGRGYCAIDLIGRDMEVEMCGLELPTLHCPNGAIVYHEEHLPIEIPAGKYKFRNTELSSGDPLEE